jgi:hypothetical protein
MVDKATRIAGVVAEHGIVVGRLEALLAEIEECRVSTFSISSNPQQYLDGEPITNEAAEALRKAEHAIQEAIVAELTGAEA